MTTLTLAEIKQAQQETIKVTKQFPVSQTRVNTIKKCYDDTSVFFGSFSLASVDDVLYLVGGNHRLEAFKQLGDPITDYPVFIQRLDSIQELVKAVQIDNGSRSMTGSEKDYLGYTFDSLGESDYKVDDAKRLRTAYLHYKISSSGSCTQETTKKIWSSVIRSLNKDERSILVTNEPALSKFVEQFQDALVVSLRNVSNPARNYKPVAEKIVGIVRPCLSDFSKVVVQKTRLSKADRAGIKACGDALIASLEADDFVPEVVENTEGRTDKAGVPYAKLVSVNIPVIGLDDIDF